MSDTGLGTATSHPGWQGILDADERILWQGQPDRRIRVELGGLRKALPSVIFILFALFWMFQAAQASVTFSLFGLIFLGIGLRNLLVPTLWPAYLRSRSWYTLTDRRAIVATDVPLRGRRLTSYPIDRDTPVEFVPGDPPSVLFSHPAISERAGFRFIPEAEQVMALIRQIQRPVGAAP